MQVVTALNIPTALWEAHPAGSLWASSRAQNNSGQLPYEHDFILSCLHITMQAAPLLLQCGTTCLPLEMCLQ